MRSLLLVLVGCSLLLSVSPLSAAPAKPKAAEGGGKVEFEKAMRYYQAQEFEAALPWFQKAYTLSGKRPSTIRALAQCERSLKHFEDAIAHFDEYLATTPTPSDAPAVSETVAILKELVAERNPTPPINDSKPPPPPTVTIAPPPPPLAPPNPPPSTPSTTARTDASEPSMLPIVALGAAGAVVITGAVLFGLGVSAKASVEDAPAGTPFNDVRDDADSAPVLTTVGGVLLGVGLAGIGGAVVWMMSD